MVSRLPGLKALRVYRGFSQESLARNINITTTAFARYETHGSIPRGEQLVSLARALDCEVWHLFHPDPLTVMGLRQPDHSANCKWLAIHKQRQRERLGLASESEAV